MVFVPPLFALTIADQAAAPLHLRLFGSPIITWQDTLLSVRRRQIRALLYRLAVDLEPVPRPELCYLFWADIPDNTARRNLTHLLTLTRQALPNPELLLTSPDHVGLDPAYTWSDTVAFRQLMQLAEVRQPNAIFESAAKLINGHFLNGFFLPGSAEFEAWIEQERMRREQSMLTALATAVDQLSQVGAYQEALAIAQRYLVIDQTAEDIHQRIIRLYAELGDYPAAMRHFNQCQAILQRELGIAPAPATLLLHEQIRSNLYSAATTAIKHKPVNVQPETKGLPSQSGLPLALTPLVGRVKELASLSELLKTTDPRVITVCGFGGIGKTKLAIAAANQVSSYFTHGVIFVDLAPLRHAGKVLGAIAQALGIDEFAELDLLEQMQQVLADQSLLLVLDNFEHLITAGPILCLLLQSLPNLKLLITSRCVLRISGEYVFTLLPLGLPQLTGLPSLPDALNIPAIRLFVDQARMHLPTFTITDETIRLVAEICMRLDGIPLAIELAAVRIKVLSLPKLLARLDQRFALLVGGRRDLPLRQQTLRQLIHWSYQLLQPAEQRLLELLAVFEHDWTLDAAEAICRATDHTDLSVIDSINILLDQHLIQCSERDPHELRFSMLATMREYSYEQLIYRGGDRAAQHAHARYFLTSARQIQEYSRSADVSLWHQQIQSELPNIRGAMRWCLQADPLLAVEYGQAMSYWWMNHAIGNEGLYWLEQIAEVIAGEAESIQAPIFEVWGGLLDREGRHSEAIKLYRRALKLYVASGHTRKVTELLVWISGSSLAEGEYRQLTAYLDQALEMDLASNDPSFKVSVLSLRGTVAMAQTHMIQAKHDFTAALELARQLPDEHLLSGVLAGFGTMTLLSGDYDEAGGLLREALLYRLQHQQIP